MKRWMNESTQEAEFSKESGSFFLSFCEWWVLYLWGWDEVKPYGFPIYGCICGHSRRIMWLGNDRSNNNPNIPTRFYLDAIHDVGSYPMIAWFDYGSENVLVAAVQSYVRADGDEEFKDIKSHEYGSSPANYRIE